MKILLDENLPKKLKRDLQEYEIYTIREKGWNGIKNGPLLKLLIDEDFNVLMTFDKNIQFQQNFRKYPITVFLLNAVDNTYDTLKELVPEIISKLSQTLITGVTEIKLK